VSSPLNALAVSRILERQHLYRADFSAAQQPPTTAHEGIPSPSSCMPFKLFCIILELNNAQLAETALQKKKSSKKLMPCVILVL
jgi:hypothetical protein